MAKTENLRDLLDEVAKSRDFKPKLIEQKVFVLWHEHFGKSIGADTLPVSLSNGVLKIYTGHSACVSEISFLKQKIITDLNAELGEPILRDIRVELRPAHKAALHRLKRVSAAPNTSKNTASMPASSDVRTPTAEELEQIELVIADVTDPDLKTSLRQLFTTQIKEKP